MDSHDIKDDVKLLLPASAVFAVYGWVVADLNPVSRVLTVVVAWAVFMVTGLAGGVVLRRLLA